MKPDPNGKYENKYPLIEWRWDRDRCKKEILGAGLCLPPKSSCFFCPNMKKGEIVALPDDLKERAIKMERNATKVAELKGLGRQYSWESLINMDKRQFKMFDDWDYNEPPCECID